MAKTTHVWLLNMGGPDTTDAIQPFLQRLLGDPMVIQLPFAWLRFVFSWLISTIRAPKVLPAYERMGGATPQLAIVEDQTRELNRLLGDRYKCRPVLRYWGPSASHAAAEVRKGDQVVLLSLYPHACGATTGTSLEDARQALVGKSAAIAEVESYPRDPLYVEAVAETLREAILEVPESVDYEVLFSAHGLPESRITQGDPYLNEIKATVAAVAAAAKLRQPHSLCFQSRVGPTKWLGPSTIDAVGATGARGVKSIVLVPIAFTSEHIETIIELDEEIAEIAHEAGIIHYARARTVGTRPTFMRALAELVRRAERDAGWHVPEDAVRAAVAAALAQSQEA